MKIACLERALIPGGFLEQSSATGITALFRDLVRIGLIHHRKPQEFSCWQLIFLRSKVNGNVYSGEELPQTQWHWPSNTWLQVRLSHLRELSEDAVGQKAELNTTPVARAYARKPHSVHIAAPPCR